MTNFFSQTLKTLLGISVTLGSLAIPLNSQQSMVSAQTTRAVVFDPPSNVRSTPNGQILCSVNSTTSINTYGSSNGWVIFIIAKFVLKLILNLLKIQVV